MGHAIGASEVVSFRRNDPRDFSPDTVWRHDLGVEWRRQIRLPRFASDREQSVALAYLAGIDSSRITYHSGRADMRIEFASGVSLTVRARLIRSSVYRDTSGAVVLGFTPWVQRAR